MTTAVGVSVATATAGCGGLLGGSTPTVGEEGRSIHLTNQLSQETVPGRFPDAGFPMRVELATIDSETLAETTVFEREFRVQEQEDRRFAGALEIDESADEYVAKATLADGTEFDGSPLDDAIMRFGPNAVGDVIGRELDVFIGPVRNRAGVLIEPDNRSVRSVSL